MFFFRERQEKKGKTCYIGCLFPNKSRLEQRAMGFNYSSNGASTTGRTDHFIPPIFEILLMVSVLSFSILGFSYHHQCLPPLPIIILFFTNANLYFFHKLSQEFLDFQINVSFSFGWRRLGIKYQYELIFGDFLQMPSCISFSHG